MIHPDPSGNTTQLTLSQWLPHWLAGKVGHLTPKTTANYRYVIHRRLLPVLGHHPLHTLTPRDVHAAYQTLVQQGFSKSLLHQAQVILKQALQEAMLADLVHRNAAQIVRRPPFLRDRRARALDSSEVKRYLAAAHRHRLGVLFEFVLATGLRRGEVCALRWAHVDLERGMLAVRESVSVVDGRATLGAPKTEAGLRDLHLAPDTVELLRRHRDAQRAEFGQLTAQVFPNPRGKRLYPDSLTKLARKIADAADLGRVRFHDLRHSYASLMALRGVPMEVISEKLGHSRPSTTVDLYQHVYPEEHERHTFTLEALLQQRPLRLQVRPRPLLEDEEGAA